VTFLIALRRLSHVLLHVVHGLWLARLRLPGRPEAERLACVQGWAGRLLQRVGVDLRIHGSLAPGAVLLAANHVSWLDITALHACAPRVRFVSKASVGHWPLLGTLARAGGTLFIERERKRDAMRVVHEMAGALGQGDAVAVFPEGTTGPGDTVLPFHANLLQAAISAGAQVQPVVLRYAQPGAPFSRAVQYVGETTLVGSLLAIVRARGITAHVHFLAPMAVTDWHRRELAQCLREQVAARLAEDQAGARAEG
jgi:1-acyl-sn-glycerol-3-phosphate acyltransferase